jgi:predicted nucleic acid-binding protein
MVLVEISPQVRALAQTVMPPAVRTLDAIHLATALRMSDQLTSFVTYDRRLADAAIAAGLTVDSPAK